MKPKSKIVKITCCEECPHMDNEYWGYNGECELLKDENGYSRCLRNEIEISKEIHPECPLVDSQNSKNKNITKELYQALLAARDHLDYCGYGDNWERECARADKLEEKIENALKLYVEKVEE